MVTGGQIQCVSRSKPLVRDIPKSHAIFDNLRVGWRCRLASLKGDRFAPNQGIVVQTCGAETRIAVIMCADLHTKNQQDWYFVCMLFCRAFLPQSAFCTPTSECFSLLNRENVLFKNIKSVKEGVKIDIHAK